MAFYPTVMETYQFQQMTDTFSGYNHNLKISEGEFFGMENLSSDHYPMLSTRKKRSVAKELQNPLGIFSKASLAYVDGSSLYYGGLDVTGYLTGKGLAINPNTEKTMVGMGAYLVIFPDKLYINTTDFSDCGAMEASAQTSGDIEYAICKQDGTAYLNPITAAAPPDSPENGTLWMDTSGKNHVLKEFNKATSSWVTIPTVYTKISAAGIGLPFSQYDGVQLSGCAGNTQVEALNGSKLIQEKGDNYIVVIGLLDQGYIQTEGTVTVSRKVPDMDFVVECQNRLWGCKYGLVDGKTVNEIRCCALGDFKNWSKYQGISTDSYTASVGSDGAWTGAVNYLGNPLFFKENHLHKVYVSNAGAHQIVDTELRGVMKGSEKSLCAVGNQLLYLSRDGVCAYTGSLPTVISQKLGHTFYKDGVAGAIGSKYYISMADTEGKYSLFCVDTDKAAWYMEDGTKAIGFASIPGELYMITSGKKLIAVNGTDGEQESNFSWYGESGLIGYTDIGQKYISRINLRVVLPVGSTAKLEIQYDSDGVWHNAGSMVGHGTGSFLLPVRPRRCDHFRYRISGTGEIRIYSLAKLYESGSDVGGADSLPF